MQLIFWCQMQFRSPLLANQGRISKRRDIRLSIDDGE